LVLQCNREQGNFAQTGQVGNKRLGSMTRQVLAHLERGCELKAPADFESLEQANGVE